MTCKFLFPVALAAACLTACNKDYNPGNAIIDPSPVYTLQSAMAELVVSPKTVTIDAVKGASFSGNSGTRYIFPANAFRTASGAPVTGTVDVQVSEYTKKSDMLFSGVLPVSGGEPLLSGGEINVEATQNGQQLQMAPGITFRANMPMKGTDATGMTLFTGKRDSGNVVNWKPVIDSAGGIATIGGDTISIISNTVNFANADRFMSHPNYQSFTITVEAGGATVSKDSVMGYTLYDEYNGVWPMSSYIASTTKFSEHHVPDIPVHFVVTAIIKGAFYGGVSAATPITGGNYIVPISKTTPKEFKKLVDAL